MINTTEKVRPPTRKELFTLRLMIFTGVAGMIFFLHGLLNKSIVGNKILYWMLIITIVFTCLKIIHEWIHYLYITVPETPPHEKEFTVDIFTTFCAGEPYEMILETLEAIQAITYPHKTFLCDEADDPYLREVCKKWGVHHVTRINKINAKAGNINNALQFSSSDLCVVLDPDHVPFPDFLDPIVSHFNNPAVGFVQIVQAYKNFDEGLIAKGAAQQTFQFYGPMMMTMNRYGTVLAIGANCTFRRAALDSIGGHAAGLAEDMHTAMQLHAKGWKSVYVPAVLARGLVPSTLSAYYSQQLKWSRGVFELLVTSYPKLFKKFTWRQKLHYGFIPLHYLSGLIFLINFLIPVFSLVFDVSPIKIDLGTFALIGLPMLAAIILIRHFVQWWVMEDEERGFHVVGGLLLIGTWWIFITGLFYTIIRKKVPYIPTPKDGTEGNNWPLNIPNLVILGISIAAIIYGLYLDWNPYTFVMASLAGLNCLFMFFNIAASRQQKFRKYKERFALLRVPMYYVAEAKKRFWKMRRRIYTGLRSSALLLTVFMVCLTVYLVQAKTEVQQYKMVSIKKQDIFLSGIFAPQDANGLTSVKTVSDLQSRYQTHFDIVSAYIPWGDEERCFLPLKLIDSVYNNGSIPMITWEPWESLFAKARHNDTLQNEKKVFARILNKDFDEYLLKFSNQLKALKRPVFLRFAHEADNPFYPWSATGNNTNEEFKQAWKYVHDFVSKNGAYNVIWVWNPWKADAANAYFPGKNYVDWIGVTCVNYGSVNKDKTWYSMEQLYKPFHRLPFFTTGLPVMLAEMGSLQTEGRQDDWFKGAAQSVKSTFHEVKAFVFFNSDVDINMPNGTYGNKLNWKLNDSSWIASVNNNKQSKKISATPTGFLETISSLTPNEAPVAESNEMFTGTKGVNYTRGESWYKNFHPVTKKEILSDFAEMKQYGINTIKQYGPGVYDQNVLAASKEMNINVHYGFWIPDNIDFFTDNKKMSALSAKIIKTVDQLKSNEKIVSWNIGNDPLQKLNFYYFKPELLYYQNAYITWLRNLVSAIKTNDSTRPVTVDVDVSDDLINITNMLYSSVPEIDSYGLILNEKSTGAETISQLSVPYFFSNATAGKYLSLAVSKPGAFIANWQDKEIKGFVSFNGLKDYQGRNKYSLYQIGNKWRGIDTPPAFPAMKILKPAITTLPNAYLTYHSLLYDKNEWKLADSIHSDIRYEWLLVKTDNFGNGLFLKKLGTGPDISFAIPDNPSTYKLHLVAIKGKVITTVESILNTPL